MSTRRRVLLAVFSALVAFPAVGGAGEAPDVPFVCEADGPAKVFPYGGRLIWEAKIAGECKTRAAQVYVAGTVQGTSDLCATATLSNVTLNSHLTYSPPLQTLIPGAITTDEVWRLKNSLSRGFMPFSVRENGETIGAGVVGLRLTGGCYKDERMTFRWSRSPVFTPNPAPIQCAGAGTLEIGQWFSTPLYLWELVGTAVCERGAEIWDVSFVADTHSEGFGLCDPAEPGGWFGGDMFFDGEWTRRSDGVTAFFNMEWEHLDPVPIPNRIHTLDAVITTSTDDGCWTYGGVYDAAVQFYVSPATQHVRSPFGGPFGALPT